MRHTVILFVVGGLTLFIFDSTVTLAAGVVLLLAAIVSGVFAVASPEFLAEED
jgi:hypothetical protein